MDRKSVRSSNVSSIGYDPERHVLEVEYKSGGVYRYFSVSPDEFHNIESAESVGKAIAMIKKSKAYGKAGEGDLA